MNPTLHREHGNTVYLADDQLPGVALRCRAHETWYVFIRNADSLFEVISETTQSTAKHKGDARFYTDSRSDNSCGVFGAFVKTRACHSLNHFRIPRHFSFSYGIPRARGGRDDPIKPASTTMVKTYGTI